MNGNTEHALSIMKKKAFIRKEIESLLPSAEAEALWQRSTEMLASILDRYPSLPEGVRAHTDKKIFPAAAVYLTARDVFGSDTAYRIVEEYSFRRADKGSKALKALIRLPGMKSLFMKLWDPLTHRMFGESSGFRNRFYPASRNEYRMDVLACPYFRYFSELGCPELTDIFCTCDDRLYGELKGLEFRRTSTLGRGGEKCDFCFRKL